MGRTRDEKHGEVLTCANDDCRKQAYVFEATEWWTLFKGKHYCFKCSVDNKEIDWRQHFLTNRIAVLKERKKTDFSLKST